MRLSQVDEGHASASGTQSPEELGRGFHFSELCFPHSEVGMIAASLRECDEWCQGNEDEEH